MGVRILEDKDGYKCLYCSTSMVVFGNVFYEHEDVQEFLDWLGKDARKFTDKELENEIYEWRSLSACCGAPKIEETDICSQCKEHS